MGKLVEKIAKLQNYEEFADLNWTGSFEDYLKIVRENPTVTRTSFQRVYDMVLSYGSETYSDNKKKNSAKIMVDGSIKHAQTEGSIHKVAATILGAESCNGWTYWHCELGNTFVPIDNLRQKFLSKNYL